MKWKLHKTGRAPMHEQVASGEDEDFGKFSLCRCLFTGGHFVKIGKKRYHITVNDIVDDLFDNLEREEKS